MDDDKELRGQTCSFEVFRVPDEQVWSSKDDDLVDGKGGWHLIGHAVPGAPPTATQGGSVADEEAEAAAAAASAAAAAFKAAVFGTNVGASARPGVSCGETGGTAARFLPQSKAEGDKIYASAEDCMGKRAVLVTEHKQLGDRMHVLAGEIERMHAEATAGMNLLAFTFTLGRKTITDFVEENSSADLPVVCARGPDDWQKHLSEVGSRPTEVAVRRISTSVAVEHQSEARRSEAKHADLPQGALSGVVSDDEVVITCLAHGLSDLLLGVTLFPSKRGHRTSAYLSRPSVLAIFAYAVRNFDAFNKMMLGAFGDETRAAYATFLGDTKTYPLSPKFHMETPLRRLALDYADPRLRLAPLIGRLFFGGWAILPNDGSEWKNPPAKMDVCLYDAATATLRCIAGQNLLAARVLADTAAAAAAAVAAAAFNAAAATAEEASGAAAAAGAAETTAKASLSAAGSYARQHQVSGQS
jgi:hypothetical protein